MTTKMYYQGWSGDHSALIEETRLVSFTIEAPPNNSARLVAKLSDPTGTRHQYYTAEATIDGAVADDGGVQTDETATANEATEDDMTLFPVVPANGDAYYFGFTEKAGGLIIDVTTAADDGGGAKPTLTWQYSQGSGVYANLAGVTDNTNSFDDTGINTVTWTIPGDWATDDEGSETGLYWVRVVTDGAWGGASPAAGQAWGPRLLGPGRVTIEDTRDAAENTIFDGRIVEARAETGYTTIVCEDWLSQLNEEQLDYDMRENLDGSGLRESTGHADVTSGVYVGCAYTNGANKYFMDHAMTWVIDQFNNMYLIFTAGMAGSVEMTVGPYADIANIALDVTDTANGYRNVWADDGTVHEMEDANNNWTMTYDYRVWLPDSAFCSSVDEVYVDVSICDEDADVYVYVYDGTSHVIVGRVPQADTGEFIRTSFRVPDAIKATMFDVNGVGHIRVAHTAVGGNMKVDLCVFRVKATNTGYSSAITISDTIRDFDDGGAAYDTLKIGTDLTADATKVWEDIPYCICKEIYKHIDTAEGGTLVSGGDNLVPLTSAANIEHTSGLSTRKFERRTRLEILQALAPYDKAMFWMPIGTTEIYWKSTFGANTASIASDAAIDAWRLKWDYLKMHNEAKVRGIRIGDYQVEQEADSADSQSLFGAVRTISKTDSGAVSDYYAAQLATAIAAREDDILMQLEADIRGLDCTYRVGTIVGITSSYLNLSDVDYVVTHWRYDSTSNKTSIRFHKKQSGLGFIEVSSYGESLHAATQRGDQIQRDSYAAKPYTDVLA